MAGFKFGAFRGRFPGVERRLLQDNAATIASDLMLGFGDIRPLWGLSTTSGELTRTPPKSLYWYLDTTWLHYDYPCSWLAAPIGQDEYDRLIFTRDDDYNVDEPVRVGGELPIEGVNDLLDGVGPYPEAYKALGVPAPTIKPSTSRTVFTDGDVEDQTTFFYTYTYVNERGEEGPPAPPSDEVTINEGFSFNVDVTVTSAPSAYNGLALVPITKYRVYRLYAQDSTQTWMYVGESSVNVLTYNDSVATKDLPGDAMVSFDWDPPPLGLKGLRGLPDGSVVGFVGNQLCFSEPGFPFAWPARYRMTTDSNIVGVGVFGSTVVVLTVGQPYVSTGPSPGERQLSKLPAEQSCVSARSIVEFGDRVVWASPDGLFSIGANGIEALTRGYMDKRTWQAEFYPETIHAYSYEDQYIAFYNESAGFILNPYAADDGITDLSFYAYSGFRHIETDTLYLAMDKDGGGSYYVEEFDADELNPFQWTWQSKVVETPVHVSPGRAQLIGTGYPFTFNLYALGDTGTPLTVANSLTASDRNAFPLPSGHLYTDWYVKVLGTTELETIVVGETIKDIQKV